MKVKGLFSLVSLLMGVTYLAAPTVALAQTAPPLSVKAGQSGREVSGYWTAERMRTAKPQTLPGAAEGLTVTSSPTSVPSEVKHSGKPTYTGPDQPQRFFPAQKIDD